MISFCLLLLVQRSEALETTSPTGDRPPNPPAARTAYAGQERAAEVVAEAVVRRGGVLRGRLITQAGGRAPASAAGLRVKLLYGSRTVAVTVTDQRGEFALRNLSAGVYRVMVEGRPGPSRHLVRLWSASAAPPLTRGETDVPIGGPVVRAQHPALFPIMSLPQAATMTGIVAGAIAAPVIYHNAQLDNSIPQSP